MRFISDLAIKAGVVGSVDFGHLHERPQWSKKVPLSQASLASVLFASFSPFLSLSLSLSYLMFALSFPPFSSSHSLLSPRTSLLSLLISFSLSWPSAYTHSPRKVSPCHLHHVAETEDLTALLGMLAPEREEKE